MSTMSIRTFQKVAPLLPPHVSIMIRGMHGIGKSDLVRQLGSTIKQLKGFSSFELIDRRLSQVTEGDVVGLPSTDGETTRFNPPDWYKRACAAPCLLFLDELNRATHEVMQAAFQIVLDHELNGWKLHPETRVVTCINTAASYTVNEVDPALLDRFWVVDLVPDVADWLVWAKQPAREDSPNFEIKKLFGKVNCLPLVTEFMSDQSNADKWLDPPHTTEPGKVHSSRRSWERLGDALALADVANKPDHEHFYAIAMGFIGTEGAIAFTEFAKNTSIRFTGEEVIDSYGKIREKIKAKNSADVYNEAIDKAITYLRSIGSVTKKQGENLRKFMEDLPGELRISFWRHLASNDPAITDAEQANKRKLELTKSCHPYIVEHLLGEFGMKPGDKNAQAKIPDYLNKENATKK